MKLTLQQKKVVNGKPEKLLLITGKTNTGKLTTLINRAAYLKNNYSFNQEDKLLFITTNENREIIKRRYDEQIKCNNYRTLFSFYSQNIEFKDKENFLYDLWNEFGDKSLKLKDDNMFFESMLEDIIEDFKRKYPRIKLFKNKKISAFLREINWIESMGILSEEDYSICSRKTAVNAEEKDAVIGKIKKNSSSRKALYKMYKLFYERLNSNGYTDKYQIVTKLIEKKAYISCKYSHIFIHRGELLTERELKFYQECACDKEYSTLSVVIDKDRVHNETGVLVRGKRMDYSYVSKKAKKIKLNKIFEVNAGKYEENYRDGIEKFQFINLNNNKRFDLSHDPSVNDELILHQEDIETEIKKEELITIPVFSNIAAGQPMYIEDGQQDSMNMPSFWFKGKKDIFMLKVKGDSMINANINDGDYVIIHKQQGVVHNDIVAASYNGEATLKRLNLKEENPMLMPENEKYDPIVILNDDIYIFGKAIGIVKGKA
ncbi:LexA family protein [Oceanirhabdus sp. W0125-5]|uniref:LexA family protein n=1 Tax=Oceanirhabdus sp. W0125-5 TaxID=2999116 RepID=UPI0022F2D4F6|nr:S24 family peptidase [Oceanirhabdus sp. W0125-5]WBW99202.1 S24 family peptidase [Oceanirhabdus sp. W0125-5]